MDPTRGILMLLWNFICFLPLFIGLLIFGVLKGVIIAPIVFIILTVGNSAIVMGLWPAHAVWTYFCVLSAKQLGPVMKLVVFILVTPPLAFWPVVVVVGSIVGGIVYGFIGPLFGTVKAVGEGKTDKFRHCVTESSAYLGLCYIIAMLSISDEYGNDILDMPEGSCIPRPTYRKNGGLQPDITTPSVSRPASFKNPPSRSSSFTTPMIPLKPLVFLSGLFQECRRQGECIVLEGFITVKEIDDAKSGKATGRVISIGLPAYCLFQTLLRSAKADSAGILLEDNVTEINAENRPKDMFYDWFLNPLLVMKDQIKAQNLTDSEAEYLGKLVLLSGDAEKLRSSNIGPPPESERRRAEFDALARRLQGITKSISRYPTYRRRFENSMKAISEELDRRNTNEHRSLSGPGPESTVFSNV